MTDLETFLAEELAQPAPDAVVAYAAELALRAPTVAAVLFYGSNLRGLSLEGVVDLYVLVDDLRAWPGAGAVVAAAGRLLPPNVEHHVAGALRFKVAVMRLDQFARGMRPRALDTTLWARFAQPSRLVWTRDDSAHARVVTAISQACATAARWAAVLGPERAAPEEFWAALFRETYATELRVERGGRPQALVAASADRWRQLSPVAFAAAGVRLSAPDDAGWVSAGLSGQDRSRGRRAWALRRALGKPLNLLRLIKAAFTFRGGADYLAWKIERHTGVPVPLTDWQRRHPILAAPAVLWRLRRAGVF